MWLHPEDVSLWGVSASRGSGIENSVPALGDMQPQTGIKPLMDENNTVWYFIEWRCREWCVKAWSLGAIQLAPPLANPQNLGKFPNSPNP